MEQRCLRYEKKKKKKIGLLGCKRSYQYLKRVMAENKEETARVRERCGG